MSDEPKLLYAHEVVAVEEAGAHETVAHLAACPSGLGWLPDGRMLLVSMEDSHGDEKARPTCLIHVAPDGAVLTVAESPA